ncbi:MAG: VWA domain-containing protein [Acidobacteria bacterium]|nr:VWA domain-containing protein [Acidobacteriota bacterium]
MASLLLLALLLVVPSPPPAQATPSPAGKGGESVILFLVDNSASLPPLDPDEKRVAALERMFTFLQGQSYRLILFGGRTEISVDDPGQYDNRGQWTDFYFAFDKVREIVKGYPEETEFRIILLTDGLLDAKPADWKDMNVPQGRELNPWVAGKTLALVGEIGLPLYVILVGDIPAEGAGGDLEQAPAFVLEMVAAANGAKASPAAQSLASFFTDDGVLLKKFVFRVGPGEGLKKIEPVVKRIVAPARPVAELQFLTFLVLPLTLFLFLLLGILVRSFPGPGDLEIVELSKGLPVYVAADRLHKVGSGGWGTTGLSLVADAKDAVATLTYQAPSVDLSGAGLDASGLDALTTRLLPMDLEELRRTLEEYADRGSKEEKIYALNLDYMAKNFDPGQAEHILTGPATERRKIPALDFLRAKVHLLSDDDIRRKLTEPRVQVVGYGRGADRKDLLPGGRIRLGRYGFLVNDVARGGRKDVRLVLYYDHVPSLLGLKTILPDAFQRVFRLRRTSERIVG